MIRPRRCELRVADAAPTVAILPSQESASCEFVGRRIYGAIEGSSRAISLLR